ncbi:PIG-L deacetylase family protein [Streptomyces sp. MI02-7b]|uniref:PIG-L deacetylase family protein n=1 Tax=Streptomyces sp. MI02-7b TaxID=462941 RepID=UPI0029A4D70E|nr:PIG-L deacetylase family protein [Streptomyces sp. MI02-7b]MDX3071143.1 PIG-L family deacetylase [Streptomyces sp. MI02-7b]
MPDAQGPPPGRPALLAVFAHPDDEALGAGGVLARHAAAGARTAVLTTTWAPDSHRAAELGDAVRLLGADRPRMLGYADHRLPESAPGRPRWCDTPLDTAIAHVVTHIREFRPAIVVTHDAYGGLTGHPDHRRTHRVTTLAVHAAGLEHLCPEAGPSWQPSALYLATRPHSAVEELGPLLTGAGKTVLSVPDELVTTTVDVRPWLDRKWNAVLAHRSEVRRERSLPGILSRLPAGTRDRILSTEHYSLIALAPSPHDHERQERT